MLQIVEPHLCRPGRRHAGGHLFEEDQDKVEVICAQGPAPAGATIEHYTAEGLKLIPGDGLLATVIPGAFDGWMLMLRDYGTLSVRDVLEPAIYYAENGHPMLPRVSATIKGLGDFFEKEWPTSYETWLPGGSAARSRMRNFKNPVLAETWKRIIRRGGSEERSRRADRSGPRRLLPRLRRRGDRQLSAARPR